MVGSDGPTIQVSSDRLAIAAVQLAKAPNRGSLTQCFLQLLATARTMGVPGDELLIMAEQQHKINQMRK